MSDPQGVRLFAFDLDGTLIRGPTICETLALRWPRSATDQLILAR